MEGMVPDMQGSKNPLIIRNYRMIFPACYKDLCFDTDALGVPYGPGPVFRDDFQLQFKIEAAPIILTYESEFILRLNFPIPSFLNPPYPNGPGVPIKGGARGAPLIDGANHIQDMSRFKVALMSGLMTGVCGANPLIRFKFKTAASIMKRAWCTMSNMTFQSVRTSEYLNEIIQRKPIEVQRKYPDNYTGEYMIYSEETNPTSGVVQVNPGSNFQATAPNRTDIPRVTSHVPPYVISLGPRGNTWNQWDNISFSTPHFSISENKVSIDLRIPLTELLPVFKIGVVPCMMINSSLIDLILDIYHPKKWALSTIFGFPLTAECWLNISTVSFPDINPMAEMIIKPKLAGDRFIAPFLDYFTLEQTISIKPQTSLDFHFNVIQFFRNVPFVSLSFLDVSTPASKLDDEAVRKVISDNVITSQFYSMSNAANTDGIVENLGTLVGPQLDPLYPLTGAEREAGGFYSLPPGIEVNDLRIMLGESAFPLTQFPMKFNDMYMYNRKHFEMYGRDFNVTRVCPISRHRHGDATYFFDISHGPFSGFTIDSDSPLQIIGRISREKITGRTNADNAAAAYEDSALNSNTQKIKVLLTIWYSNNFNAMLNSGGVVPLQ